MGGEDNRDALERGSVENGQRYLPMHQVKMNDVGPNLLQDGFEFLLCLRRVNEGQPRSDFLDKAIVVVVDVRNEVFLLGTRHVPLIFHGEEEHLVTEASQAFSQREIVSL